MPPYEQDRAPLLRGVLPVNLFDKAVELVVQFLVLADMHPAQAALLDENNLSFILGKFLKETVNGLDLLDNAFGVIDPVQTYNDKYIFAYRKFIADFPFRALHLG